MRFPFPVVGQSSPAQPPMTARLAWLDAAKAYGMFLVYYGHFVERISDLQGFVVGTAAFSQYKFIYAFHMPLFFILSGFVYKDRKQKFSSFLTHRLLTRILPAIFFNLVAVCIQFLLAGGGSGFYERYQETNVLLDFLSGYPFGNFITWFLFCLFTVELLNYIARPFVKADVWRRGGLAALTLLGGYFIGLNSNTLQGLPLRGFDFWYFNQALVGFSFYQIGFILKQSEFMTLVQNSFYRYLALGLTLISTLALFGLNQGPFAADRSLVLMAGASYGNLFLFSITAITGSLFIITLSLFIPAGKGLTFVGQNTLILLGLNFFFAGFAKPVIEKIGLSVFDNGWAVLVFCTALTLISFLVSVPVIQLLHRFFPQLIGKPKLRGPLLPQLLR
ncbi:acyltransferase family protein [Leptothoe spongobia]|uniref:Acyltransferase family protein n=1 Tax=Leptothoe spongobia TAU-MAC 1115 TaxID=1967444 RepID=A0A947DF46_9CYAN|nr:acyltransferase family protein [Leptothoe spongobia]MBT9315878.1 acyltransferase family protein [Leptothoe spongobia TAU-MAC 1115]